MRDNHRNVWNRLLSSIGSLAFCALLVLALANCGGSLGSSPGARATYQPTTTIFPTAPTGTAPTSTTQPSATSTGAPTATPGAAPTATVAGKPTPIKTPLPTATSGAAPTGTTQTAPIVTAYLYSRVDYPLQIPVGGNDTVTLIVSLQKNILTVTPVAGNGQTAVGAPIALPTDVQHYQEIDVAASANTTGTSPVVWQLTSPISQTLLNVPGADPASLSRYNDEVDFHWSVRGVNAGQNLATITLSLTYIYLDGHQSQGTIETTQAPIPIVAVQPTAANTWLPNIKLPVTLVAILGGLFGILQFLWSAYQTGKEVKEAAAHAHKILTKRNG